MQLIVHQANSGAIVFGFGNMGETGRELVNHWRDVGQPVEA